MLDIFRLDDCGLIWLEAAETLELARARVEELAARSPVGYLIVDLATGSRYVINPVDTEQPRTSRGAQID